MKKLIPLLLSAIALLFGTQKAFSITLAANATSNNGTGGIFLTLTTNAAAVDIVAFNTMFGSAAATPVSVEVYTRTGAYAGFTGAATGWTLLGTINTVSAGTTVLAPINVSALGITIPASTTQSFYLQSITTGGGIRYFGTGTTSVTNFNDANLALFTDISRTGNVAFAGTQFQPRAFTGTIDYNLSGPPCNAPATPIISGITTTSANMNWTAVAGATGYQVAVTTSSTPPATGTAITTTTHSAPGLTPATSYFFHIRTVCGAGFSTWVTVPFNTPASCSAPSAAVISNILQTSATATWGAVPSSTGYEWFVNTSSTPPASGNATGTTSQALSGLTVGTQYYFHVRNNCGGGLFSSWSSTVFSTPCNPITGLNVSSISFNGATLGWNAVPNSAGYEWVVTTNPVPPASGTAAAGPTANATGLNGGTLYYVHVRNSCGAAGFSSWTTTTFTTSSSCTVPSNIIITNVGPTGADIQWDPVPGAIGFEYIVDNTPQSPATAGSAIAFNHYTPANLVSATRYYVHLRTNCGPGGFSPWVTVQFTTDTLCFAPVAVIEDVTGTTANITWQPEANAINYQYLVTTNVTPPFSGYATTAISYQAKGLTKNTQYYMHLRSYCGGNDISSWRSTGFVTNEKTTSVSSASKGGPSMTVYPNPVEDVLTLKISSGSKAVNGMATLIDIAGRTVKQQNINTETTTIDMSSVPAGVYMLRYNDSNNTTTTRIVKQ